MEVEYNTLFFKLGCCTICLQLQLAPLMDLGQSVWKPFKNVDFRIWGSKFSNFWLPKSCMRYYLSNNINYIQCNFVLHYYSIFIQLHPERMDVLILSISKCVKEEQWRAFIIFSTIFVFMKGRVIFFVKTIYKIFYIYLSLNCFSAVCTIAYISLVKYLVHNH